MTGRQLAAPRRLTDAERPAAVPLSFQQERLWLLDQLQPGSNAFNLPLAITLDGPLRLSALRAALGACVLRHESCRTAFRLASGRPWQVVLPFRPPALPLVDLAGLPHLAVERRAAEVAAREARRPFPLRDGRLLRATLLRLGPRHHRLLLTRHHTASDGWSLGVLLGDLAATYRAAVAGLPHGLGEPPMPYTDYAVWQRSCWGAQAEDPELRAWVARLRDAPHGLAMLREPPLDAESPPAAAVALRLDPGQADGVRALAAAEGATAFAVLLAAYGAVLGMAAGQDEVVVGTSVAGRDHPGLEPVHGCFADLLPVLLCPGGARTLGEAIADARHAAVQALAHRDVPYDRAVALVRPAGGLSPAPLFKAVLTMQNTPPVAVDLPDLDATLEPVAQVAPKYPLALTVTPRAGGLDLLFEYDPRAADRDLVERLAQRLVELLRVGPARPGAPFAELLAGGDHATGVHATARATPPLVPELVAARVRARGDAVAVSAGSERLTYAQLDRRAGAVASALRAAGAGPESVVAVDLPPSPDLAVAMLGAWKAGAAYLPLDDGDPPARRAEIVARAGAVAVVTRAGRAGAGGITAVAVDALPPLPPAAPAAWHPDQLAYVISTSGSTGAPRPVMVTHGNLAGLLAASAQVVPAGAGDVWTLAHSAAFDFSVWELWGALATGGRVAVVPPAVRRAPAELCALVRREGVSVLAHTPTAFAQLAPVALSAGWPAATRLRRVVLGGERCDPARLAAWLEATGAAGPSLVNMYGITETCVHVTHRRLWAADAGAGGTSPIGRALPGMTLRAVDGHGATVHPGGRGELVVGGCGVARGYLGLPGDTAERFRPDAAAARRGARAYHSGDVAEVLPSAEFAYVGRRDGQVKLRGFRIEPAEVEAALERLPGVRAAAVTLHRAERGDVLAAYLVPDGEALGPDDRLRRALATMLPRHMVPTLLTVVDRLPLTRNGKLDRAALPPPRPREVAGAATPARTPTERLLSGLLAELLGVPCVGVRDDFYELGADSLLITQFHGRVVDALGIDLPMRRVYGALDVASLAETVDGIRAQAERSRLGALLDEIEALPDDEARRRLRELEEGPRAAPGHPPGVPR